MKKQSGFIMLNRVIADWEWYTDVNTAHLFIHCLLKSNYSDKKWQGISINKGEFITSIEKLAAETGLTISKVRTSIKKLKSTNAITMEATSRYSLIRIDSLYLDNKSVGSNYSNLNDKLTDKPTAKQISIKSQTDNNQIATTNKNKEDNIKIKIERFSEEVYAHHTFNKTILNSFFNYWSELEKSGSKMRYENQEYWNLESRLKKWTENERPKNINQKSQFHKNR